MARMSGAKWSGEHSPRRGMSRYDIVCIHTIVGYAPAHAAHFSTSGGGTIWQSRDTRYRSAANLNGNHRVISIENADHGAGFPSWNTNGSNVPPFTSKQIESIAQILAWAHRTHGIPLQLVRDSKPNSRGIAYHRLGCDPYRASGGELWSSAYGKVCPGDKRIAQIPQIINRARQIVGGAAHEEDDPLAFIDGPEEFRKLVRQANSQYHTSPEGREATTQALILALRGSDGLSKELRAEVAKAVAAGVANGFAQSASRATKLGRNLGNNMRDTLVRAGFAKNVADEVHDRKG